jgi:hypothetical protein
MDKEDYEILKSDVVETWTPNDFWWLDVLVFSYVGDSDKGGELLGNILPTVQKGLLGTVTIASTGRLDIVWWISRAKGKQPLVNNTDVRVTFWDWAYVQWGVPWAFWPPPLSLKEEWVSAMWTVMYNENEQDPFLDGDNIGKLLEGIADQMGDNVLALFWAVSNPTCYPCKFTALITSLTNADGEFLKGKYHLCTKVKGNLMKDFDFQNKTWKYTPQCALYLWGGIEGAHSHWDCMFMQSINKQRGNHSQVALSWKQGKYFMWEDHIILHNLGKTVDTLEKGLVAVKAHLEALEKPSTGQNQQTACQGKNVRIDL